MLNELSIKSLLKDFSSTTKKDWLKVAYNETQLNSIDQLTWKGTNELLFLPYYDKQDREKPGIKNNFDLNAANKNFHTARSWFNQPPVTVSDERTANLQALSHLQLGADGVLFECNNTPDLKILLNEIQLIHCHVTFSLPDISSGISLINHCKAHHTDLEKIQGGILWKNIPHDVERILNDSQGLKNFLSLGIWIEQAKDPIEEIVHALGLGLNLVDSLTDKGFTPEKIFPLIFFSLEASNHFFLTAAKLKALRILWYQIIHAYNADHSYDDIHLHVRCTPFKNKEYEPQGNMLQSPVAALAAICGGCQGLTLYSQDHVNTTTERIARNVSGILREEAHLNVVADPLAGSYFIDTLVNDMAQNAWKKFQDKMK